MWRGLDKNLPFSGHLYVQYIPILGVSRTNTVVSKYSPRLFCSISSLLHYKEQLFTHFKVLLISLWWLGPPCDYICFICRAVQYQHNSCVSVVCLQITTGRTGIEIVSYWSTVTLQHWGTEKLLHRRTGELQNCCTATFQHSDTVALKFRLRCTKCISER